MKQKKAKADVLDKEKGKLSDPDNFGAVNPTASAEEKKQFKDLDD
jgi:hypothetical protein